MVDTGSTDGTQALAKELGWRVVERPDLCSLDLVELGSRTRQKDWDEFSAHEHFQGGVLRSFAEARQCSFDAAHNNLCMWLDLDDELCNPQILRPILDQVFSDGAKGALFLRYDYAHADDGSCTTTLWRERVVTRDDFKWVGLCHETLIPHDPTFKDLNILRDPAVPVFVRHKNPKEHKFSDLRNYVILRHDLESSPYRDPRTLFYLGNACRGLEDPAEALHWYEEFIGQSGNRDDIMAALFSMSACWAMQQRYWKALQVCGRAMHVQPEDPRVYYNMATLWLKLKHYKNVLVCTKLGDQLKMPDTLHAVDPTTVNFQPAAVAAIASRELRRPDEAVEFAARALRERPNYEPARRGLQDMQQWAAAEKHGQAVMRALAAAKDPYAVLDQLRISPHMARYGVGEPEEVVPGADGSRQTVAIWCGTAAEPWGPPSEGEGIGASEKMVVDLAKRLAERGLAVSVYATLNCEEGEYDGVHWRQTAHFDPRLFRDYVVVWRVPAVIGHIPFRAGKLYVWMHDVGNDSVWDTKKLALVDKVLFLSRFQRSKHPSVPESKVYYTRNGIDLARHVYAGEEKEKKIVFASSPDRGWLSAVRAFRESGLEHEGWTLHMFYGFKDLWRKLAADQEYGFMVDLGRECRLLEYEDECLAACDGRTVINRGRVGWAEMAHELKTASVWLYPTNFDEISCVVAMEAMAAGCICVSTDSAALAETLAEYPRWNLLPRARTTWGTELRGAVRKIWGPPEEAARHAEKFDIDALANQWVEDLFCE